MNGRTGGTRMSSTGIDRVVKKTLRLSISLGAVVAQRARSTRCHELPLGSASEYCDRGAGCLGFGRVASGWMARSVHLGCYIAQSQRREKGVGVQPLLRWLFRRLLLTRSSNPSIHHTNRRPFLFLGSCQ